MKSCPVSLKVERFWRLFVLSFCKDKFDARLLIEAFGIINFGF